MIASFIVRLVTAEGDLLAWAEQMAESKPQGRPRSTPFNALGPTRFVVEKDGIASHLVVHWAELDLVRKAPIMNPTPVKALQVVDYHWIEPVWLCHGAGAEQIPALERARKIMAGLPAVSIVDELLRQARQDMDIPLPSVTVRSPAKVCPPPAQMGVVSLV